jgi:hypothetical protein
VAASAASGGGAGQLATPAPGSGARTVSAAAPIATAPVVVAPVVVAPAPTPAPPTHTTTGASGAG